MQKLIEAAQEIVPLRQRRERMRQPMEAIAVCKYSNDKVSIAKDEVVTVSEITTELDCAADDMKEGMEELTKMPFHQQQMFASNYRRLADCFK